MNITWQINSKDVAEVKKFIDSHKSDSFVEMRRQRNLSQTKTSISIDEFWNTMVSCLLTSQQNSEPNSAVMRFIKTSPFPLSYEVCLKQSDLHGFVQKVLGEFGGIRFSVEKIPSYIEENFYLLEHEMWTPTLEVINEILINGTAHAERKAADFIADKFKGFGPKQSRNLLQWLGLTVYEIPIDSRVTKWLNNFGFPIKISAKALQDRNYYNLVSEGVQQLCAESDVPPCMLDAAIFSNVDKASIRMSKEEKEEFNRYIDMKRRGEIE